MTRKILCKHCIKSLCPDAPFPVRTVVTPYPNERIKLLSGKALYQCFCDNCGAPIARGADCVAYTNWSTKNTRSKYMPWERSYIDPHAVPEYKDIERVNTI